MRPEILRLAAFGAYASAQEFDLAALGPHRLFLIHGPTGAGKTTLLDAICFALFGKSSGEERGATDLRSHHASPSVETFVELDFALGERRYRIRRTPVQSITGSRGKLVSRTPQVTLWQRGAGGNLLVVAEQTTPVREAEVLIERWRQHYNTTRPHSALGYRPLAPEAVLPWLAGPAYAPLRQGQPARPEPGLNLS